jgi:opacity protein-like surface antigen
MRSFLAFLLGIAVSIGAALVHDTVYSAPTDKPYVNWNHVQDSVRRGYDLVREQWDQLTK